LVFDLGLVFGLKQEGIVEPTSGLLPSCERGLLRKFFALGSGAALVGGWLGADVWGENPLNLSLGVILFYFAGGGARSTRAPQKRPQAMSLLVYGRGPSLDSSAGAEERRGGEAGRGGAWWVSGEYSMRWSNVRQGRSAWGR